MAVNVVFLHAGTTSWVVPTGVSVVRVECIGPGGNGSYGTTNESAKPGGGGGAYALKAALSVTSGSTLSCQVGAGGSQQDTWFGHPSTVRATAGKNGAPDTPPVASPGSIGDLVYDGGLGGGNFSSTGSFAGGGGGGAGGPDGPGTAGSSVGSSLGGGGGGAANGGTAPTSGTGGGVGGAARDGTPGGAAGVNNVQPGQNGENGSGGGGGANGNTVYGVAGDGSADVRWVSTDTGETAGPGSGGGGCGRGASSATLVFAGDGGGYGGGGGGRRGSASTPTSVGAPGIIVLTYEDTGSAPTLNALELSPSTVLSTASVGADVGALSGVTTGSTLTLLDNASGQFALDGVTVKVAASLTVGSYQIVLEEVLEGASNSPRQTTIGIVVAAPPDPGAGVMSFSGSVVTSRLTGAIGLDIPAHVAGDIILVWGYVDGTTGTLPDPAEPGWLVLDRPAGGNANSHALFGMVAPASGQTFSTSFGGASSWVVHVYSPSAGFDLDIGNFISASGSGGDVVYSPLLVDVSGLSWVVAFAGHRSANTALEIPPTGMVNRSLGESAFDEVVGHDTNGPVSSWGGASVSVGGTSSSWRSAVVEIVAIATITARPTFQAFIID